MHTYVPMDMHTPYTYNTHVHTGRVTDTGLYPRAPSPRQGPQCCAPRLGAFLLQREPWLPTPTPSLSAITDTESVPTVVPKPLQKQS